MRISIFPSMLAAAVMAVATPLQAQNEAMLRQAFEGKVVAVKIDMPATQQGVDVYPLDQIPIDFREVAQRLKDNSTALRIGQSVMVTKVVIKIRDQRGKLLEAGEARKRGHDWWEYVPHVTGQILTAEAWDLPGNVTKFVL